MKVCFEQSEDAIALAEKQLDLSFPRAATYWIASRFDDGRLAGVAVFINREAGNICLHVAAQSPMWFHPAFVRAMFSYPFQTLNLRRLTATIVATNEPCLRLARKVGFVEEGRMPGFDFGDLVIFGMLKGECKWVDSLKASSAPARRPQTPMQPAMRRRRHAQKRRG